MREDHLGDVQHLEKLVARVVWENVKSEEHFKSEWCFKRKKKMDKNFVACVLMKGGSVRWKLLHCI